MSRFSNQRVIIRALEDSVRDHRLRLVATTRSIELPHGTLMVVSGFVLTAAEVFPGLRAVVGLAFSKKPGQRRVHFLRLVLEAPRLLACYRRILPRRRVAIVRGPERPG